MHRNSLACFAGADVHFAKQQLMAALGNTQMLDAAARGRIEELQVCLHGYEFWLYSHIAK